MASNLVLSGHPAGGPQSPAAASSPGVRPVNRVALASAVAGAAAGLAMALLLGYTAMATAAAGLFMAALAALAAIDFQERRLPNRLTYPGTAVALALAAISGGGATLLMALLGLLAAGGVMLLVWLAGRGRLGLGDVKLAAFGGAVLGPSGVPAFLLTGTLVGAAVALLLLASGRSRRSTFAYGPWLAVGAVVALIMTGPLVR